MSRHKALVAAGFTLAVLTLASCTSADADDSSAKKSGPAVVAPGKPGEQAKTLSPDEAAKARPENAPNSADVSYVQKMITHHEQALEMTALAAKHAKAKAVRGIADRIDAAQGPEIDAMEGWLKRYGEPKTPKGEPGHDHSAMPGMATGKQLDALGRARGADFDDLFLELMIAHHEGAVTMATDVLSQGNDVIVEEMANDVIAQQSSEIDRMRDM